MIKGVENGHTYKLKIIFAHFPISVKVKGAEVHVENFFGERSPRVSQIRGDATKVLVAGEDVIVQGPSLEDVSQTAANIELSTRIRDKDHRVFLDGLYIYSKEEGMQ
jgi:large subunit ribosomal protein L6